MVCDSTIDHIQIHMKASQIEAITPETYMLLCQSPTICNTREQSTTFEKLLPTLNQSQKKKRPKKYTREIRTKDDNFLHFEIYVACKSSRSSVIPKNKRSNKNFKSHRGLSYTTFKAITSALTKSCM